MRLRQRNKVSSRESNILIYQEDCEMVAVIMAQ